MEKILKLSNPILCDNCDALFKEFDINLDFLYKVMKYLENYSLSNFYYEGKDIDETFRLIQALRMLGNCNREYLQY
jgi:hypothetical protein